MIIGYVTVSHKGSSPLFEEPNVVVKPQSGPGGRTCSSLVCRAARRAASQMASTSAASFFSGCRPRCKKPSNLMCPVIECVLLSGLSLRPFKKPRAGMVICGSGPNLLQELSSSRMMSGFPDPAWLRVPFVAAH
ncbi:hypothetical protein EOD29_24410 [Mesorhizobium sp. M1A.T.Ca.IN.004.03.1.1]|nr:hypothetical protein EOD29_24410 [Mesorhizobium sp. M1A.T.Ca.IN.004.03.1.1]